MNANWKSRVPLALAALLAVVVLVVLIQSRPAHALIEAAGAGARYTVLDTEGHNLIVTDNATNSVYFYTVDKGQEAGADLKFRGSIDLNQVGKPAIKPTKAKE